MEGVILVIAYAVISAVGLSMAVGIGLITDHIGIHVSTLAFFAAAAVVLTAAWPLALRLTGPTEVLVAARK